MAMSLQNESLALLEQRPWGNASVTSYAKSGLLNTTMELNLLQNGFWHYQFPNRAEDPMVTVGARQPAKTFPANRRSVFDRYRMNARCDSPQAH